MAQEHHIVFDPFRFDVTHGRLWRCMRDPRGPGRHSGGTAIPRDDRPAGIAVPRAGR
jgi:hypothetical protein